MSCLEFIYIPVILYLYLRTWKYNVLIDDPVKRDGYMYVITSKKEDPALYEKRKSLLATFTNIGVFIAVCGYIHYLWGWKAALLYAVFPLNVSGVAWTTGNYYMSTVLLVLATHLSLSTPYIGIVFALLFYTAALNSTLMCIGYILPALFFPLGWTLVWPLYTFLIGKRMRSGLTQRGAIIKNENVSVGFKINYLINAPKLLAYYIQLSLFPMRLGFFHSVGRSKRFRSKFMLVISCVCALLFWYLFIGFNSYLAVLWFSSIVIFSQFVIFGQFSSERYTYLANVAFCVFVAHIVPNDVVLAVLVTAYFFRSYEYIPAFKHNRNLFSYSITQFPDAPENYNNLASYYLDLNNPFEAIKPLIAAEKLSLGKKYRIHANLAACYGMLGDRTGDVNYYKEAYRWMEIASADAPTDRMEILQEKKQMVKNRIIEMERSGKKIRKKIKNSRRGK